MFVRNKRPGSSARFFKAPTNKKLRGTWIGSPSNRDGNDICARIQKLFDVIDLCYSRLQIGFNAEYVPIDNDFEGIRCCDFQPGLLGRSIKKNLPSKVSYRSKLGRLYPLGSAEVQLVLPMQGTGEGAKPEVTKRASAKQHQDQ